MFTVDGVAWSIPCDITRISEVRMSAISGTLLNGQIFNDPEGTYLQYEVSLCPNPRNMGEYYALYDILTEPVEGHTFTLPYNEGTVEITGCCKPIRDNYVRRADGTPYWSGVTFSIQSNGPTKEVNLQRAIKRGLTPLPDVQTPQIGDTYTYTQNGWSRVTQ